MKSISAAATCWSAKISAPQPARNFRPRSCGCIPSRSIPHKIYVLKHTTQTVRARVNQIRYRVDINTLEHAPATKLDLNEIGAVDVKTTLPLFFDPYHSESHHGKLHPDRSADNATVAAGIIERAIEHGIACHGRASQAQHEGRTHPAIRPSRRPPSG